jgi:integral membrane protein (TIGR01906 family)
MDKLLPILTRLKKITSKIIPIIIWVAYPIVIIMLFASLLTSNPYLRISKGLYESHNDITFDHNYVAKELIDYLNYKHDDLSFGGSESDTEQIMDEQEVKHMEDVKILYTRLRILAGVSLLIVITLTAYMYYKDKPLLYHTYKNIFWLPLGFLIFVGTWFLIDFARIFTWFHELLFDNDDWMIENYNVLIPLLPENFWLVSGVIILFGTVIALAFTVFIARRFLKTLS